MRVKASAAAGRAAAPVAPKQRVNFDYGKVEVQHLSSLLRGQAMRRGRGGWCMVFSEEGTTCFTCSGTAKQELMKLQVFSTCIDAEFTLGVRQTIS